MPIVTDSEVARLEKRQRGLQRVASAINDLTIYAEIQATKKRIIELGGNTIEEVFTSTNKVVVTNPLDIPDHDE